MRPFVRHLTLVSQYPVSQAIAPGPHLRLTRGYRNISPSSSSALSGVAGSANYDRAAFGLTNVTNPCWTGSFTSATLGSVYSMLNSYLFWDEVHPTAVANAETARAESVQVVSRAGSSAGSYPHALK